MIGTLEVKGALPTSGALMMLHRQTSRIAAKRLDALEQEAEEKGGVQQMLTEHFAKVYKVSMARAA